MRVTFKRDAREIAPVNGVAPIRAVDAQNEQQKQRRNPDTAGAPSAARSRPRPQSAFDATRVAELRAALAEGRIEFDPTKLAALIQRYHGSKK